MIWTGLCYKNIHYDLGYSLLQEYLVGSDLDYSMLQEYPFWLGLFNVTRICLLTRSRKIFLVVWYSGQQNKMKRLFRLLCGIWDMHVSSFPPAISTCWLHKQNSYQSSRELSWTYQQWAGVITKFSQHLNDYSCEDDKSK